jgi:elongation factor 2
MSAINDKDNIRNISIIAHVDHGKSTLTDTLANRAGLVSDQDTGTKRITDNREDEVARGITIKSTGLSMTYDHEGRTYNVNLVDSPGHVDFSSEVSAALRITDGAIVVVDSVEGVAVQTETVLRQSLAEQVQPILFVNKMDRYIFELHLDPEAAYQRLTRIIETVNVILSTYKTDNSKIKLDLSPDMETVYFGSGLHSWGFGIHTFARIYAKKLGIDEAVLKKKLWGDYFFDDETKKIVKESTKNGKPLERTFCKFILQPVFDMARSITNKDEEKRLKLFKLYGVTVSVGEMNKAGKENDPDEKKMYKAAMRKFVPLSDALLHGIVNHLPSPQTAQRYRYLSLYDGPAEDEAAVAIRDCNPAGPLMLYISKMIPMDDGGQFFAFGRIFSGTVITGQKVRIMGANYKVGGKNDVFENKSIQRVVKMVSSKIEPCESVECGNTVAVVGVDQFLLKSGTITTSPTACPIKTMKFSVSPVVRVAVEPMNAVDLPKLVKGLAKLSKSDPCVQCLTTESGEHIVAATGELHMEICLGDLRKFINPKDPESTIKVSTPVVPLRETVTDRSSQVCLAKSPNRHNRLYLTAEPIVEDLVKQLASKEIHSRGDVNGQSRVLVGHGWDPNDSKKIWAFGPEGDEETNLFVDTTKGVDHLNEIKDSVVSGFMIQASSGVLCDEPVRGVRYNLCDVTLHSDAVHRGAGQLIPTAQRALAAATLTAKPAIMEPVYLAEILVPNTFVGTVYSCISHKRGTVFNEESSPDNPLCNLKAYLPVLESFGFNGFLRSQTSGQASPQMVFSHWQVMPGDPLDPSTPSGKIVKETRKRKGLSEQVPALDNYLDKL